MTSSSLTLSRGIISVLALVTAAGVGACGAAAPPRELRDARAAYAAAASGPAGTLTPAELVDAKKALDKAERSFAEDGASDETVDAAYIAQRRAQIANARGHTAAAQAAEVRATALLARVNADRLRSTQRELGEARGDVNRAEQRLQVKGVELGATAAALAAEKKARAAAEARVKEAMDKLALAASLQVKEEPRGTVITLPSNVMFATGKWQLLPGVMSKLDAVATALKEQSDVTITVEGHTDSRGTSESNLELGKKRAESVATYLKSKGVPKDQISAVGIGEAQPIGDNDTATGRSQNRRVEIIVTPREKR
jgi:outer membrane protein OmpA-like peptidoglycan-associated protein